MLKNIMEVLWSEVTDLSIQEEKLAGFGTQPAG